MKIIQLQTENVKYLKAVQINTDGSPAVIIGGKNGQGKSSVLDAIKWALAGKKVMDDKPIRTGQKGAKTVLLLGKDNKPELKVTQFITSSGERLIVEDAGREGMTYRTPQAILDKLHSIVGFDPLEFVRMKKEKALETLKNLVGIDFR